MSESLPTLFCFGYGFSARHLGARLLREGWTVMTTARNADKRAALEAQGVVALPFEGLDLAQVLPPRAHILISAAPDESGDPVLAQYGEVICALRDRITWIGYLSTTAVYGDHGGGPVSEETPVNAGSERGQRRVEAERAWLDLHKSDALPVHIFRLAGIYGVGRGPFEKVRNGTARMVIKEGQVFGRIHAEDIAQTVLASINAPDPGGVYNVTDDLTCPPQDVIAHAAELLGLPSPPEVDFEEAELSPMARSFYSENKRVSNRRLREELGVELKYPTYREGLAAILAAEKAQD